MLEDMEFKVWDRNGEPWFLVQQVLVAMGFKPHNATNLLRNLDDTEKLVENLNKITESNRIAGNPKRWFVSESGLYKLIMRSNLKEAKEFQDWVTKVVLPAIRKDGAYVEGEGKLASGEMSEDEFVFKAMEIMQGGGISRLPLALERYTVQTRFLY